ncbi:MAG: DUF4296 domain-containing protein [Bacteroidales bacterium]|jgi:hypothetical protein|nr:DUF4296 domain-containing protein [Bacteroidales bacterium]
MNKQSKILHIVAAAVALAASLAASSCHKKGILPKDDVADIMYRMFVVDEYAKKYFPVNQAADTMLLYQHIFDEYNCTLEDYRNSIRYYIPDEKAYSYILDRAVRTAQDSASKANKELNMDRPKGTIVRVPDLAPGVEVQKEEWWTKRIDGNEAPKGSFHDYLEGIARSAKEMEKTRQREEKIIQANEQPKMIEEEDNDFIQEELEFK